jgi:hypothetical protein
MKIRETIRNWHRHLRGDLPGGLDALLHDDVVFHSPVVFTPQVGKAITGISTLAVGSILTFCAIVIGAAGTMKFQYWRMMQEA